MEAQVCCLITNRIGYGVALLQRRGFFPVEPALECVLWGFQVGDEEEEEDADDFLEADEAREAQRLAQKASDARRASSARQQQSHGQPQEEWSRRGGAAHLESAIDSLTRRYQDQSFEEGEEDDDEFDDGEALDCMYTVLHPISLHVEFVQVFGDLNCQQRRTVFAVYGCRRGVERGEFAPRYARPKAVDGEGGQGGHVQRVRVPISPSPSPTSFRTLPDCALPTAALSS